MTTIIMILAIGIVAGFMLGFALADEAYGVEEDLYELKMGFINE